MYPVKPGAVSLIVSINLTSFWDIVERSLGKEMGISLGLKRMLFHSF